MVCFFSPVAVSLWSPSFVQELLPAAEKTALLYHLSYLCLANFPNLERIIRSRAVETQLLFGSSDATMLKALEAELNNLITDKSALKQKQCQLELQIIDWQMKFAKANFDRNSRPDPIHLNEVQSSLSKIQAILIQLKNFWENVAQMLDYLEQKTFVGEELIEDLADLKEEFLESIETAKEAWSSFVAGCKKASVIFKLQTKDAYKFLETSPSSLSKEQWQKEYESVKEQLQNIDPQQSVTSSDTPAITA
ncbi:hypothetical protein QQF64_023795 [Cirrhinus molitorella]|uniref:Uncharacterized protein n=1 Tax=Cirrhinus molitorella TaxID=172907 RepID=A0ABR3NK11_9TELE